MIAWVFVYKLELSAMAYSVNKVVGLLNEDCSYIDSNDDDLGFELEKFSRLTLILNTAEVYI